MKRLLPLAAILAVLSPLLAQADDVHFPPRRPGLWENTMKSGMGTMVSKSCTSRETDRAIMEHGIDAMRKKGGKAVVTGGGGKFHVTTVMNMAGHVMTTNEDLVFTGDTAMHVQGAMHIDPPFAQQPGMRNGDIMENDGKWVGPCPADMKPGDMIIGDRKVNILNAQPPGPSPAK
jgi:hypothetical protein